MVESPENMDPSPYGALREGFAYVRELSDAIRAFEYSFDVTKALKTNILSEVTSGS